MRKSRSVALLIPPDLGVRRECIRGIWEYASARTDWEVFLVWPMRWPTWRESLRNREIDGALIWPTIREDLTHVLPLRRPAVLLGSVSRMGGMPCVSPDNIEAARIGARALLDLGLRTIAFYSDRPALPYGEARLKGYLEVVKHRGLTPRILEMNGTTRWSRLRAWLNRLPKPAGVLANTDAAGLDVIAAAQQRGIEVPGELAVIGIGVDDLRCSLASSSLSHVVLPGYEIGMTAAEILDGLFRGRKRPRPLELIAPRRLAPGRSSEFLPREDPHVYAALRYIQDHAAGDLQVSHVLRAVPMSRRPLEKRFKQITGKTLQKAIWAARLDRACRLLIETNLSISEVADAGGFAQPQQLTEVFKRERGLSPRDYRSRYRRT